MLAAVVWTHWFNTLHILSSLTFLFSMKLCITSTVLLLSVLQRTAPAQASVQQPPPTASSRIYGSQTIHRSLINGQTLVDTTVSDTAGWCHISLVQPLFSGIILLHMTLNGKGSRVVGAHRTTTVACWRGADRGSLRPSAHC